MEHEAAPFIEHINLKKQDDFFSPKAPFEAFSGTYGECNVTVVTNGKDEVHGTGAENVGTVPAALAVFMALDKLPETDLLINAGTCGGFRRMGAEIGDVFLTTAVANHDRRIPVPQTIPLPDYTAYGVGKIESLKVEQLAKSVNAKMGVCTTGNSLDKTEEDDRRMKANQASVKDMEAAAIGWACELHETPHFGIKVVTDIVDGEHPTQDEFMANLAAAAESLQKALPKVIEEVCGKGHDEL